MSACNSSLLEPTSGWANGKEVAMIFSHDLTIVLHNHCEALVAPVPLDMLPLPPLLLACREQMARFRRSAENDARFGLELFRRALDARDPDAWRGLVDLYQPVLLARLRQRGVASDLAEEAVQEALVTLWIRSDCGTFSTC